MALSAYHTFALPVESYYEPTEEIEFSELENTLSDGFYSQALFGSNTGLRSWSLKLPTLATTGLVPGVTGINGEPVSREEYLWDLYCETKVTGQPFAFQSQRNGQYYLVRFDDKILSYDQARVKLYSTGVKLKQVRIQGETVYTPGALSQTWNSFDPVTFPDTLPFPYVNGWQGSSGDLGGSVIEAQSTDVIAGTSGTLPILRFSTTTNNGFLASTIPLFGAKDIYLLMKMREATFSNFAGIVTSDASTAALIGDSGTSKFFNFTFGAGYTYEKNGVAYAESNQQAPMNNVWGIVHIRYETGFSLTNMQVGKDRAFAGRFAEMDLAYLIISDVLFPQSANREIYEFLTILKNQLV